MEDEETQQSSQTGVVEEALNVAPAPSAVHARGVLGVVCVAIVVSLLIRRLGHSNLAAELRRWLPVGYTAIWGLAVLAVTLIYARGLPSTWFLAIWLLFLVVAFASVGWLRSVMSGVALSIEGRIKLGDSLRINDISGEVVAFGVRALRLRAVDGSIHDIPNERLVTEPVTNLSGDGGDSATELVVPVPDGVDPDAAVEVARRIAILSPLASPRHRPEVFLDSSGRQGRRYELRIRGYAFDAAYQDHFRSDVVSRIQSEFTSSSVSQHLHAEDLVRSD